MIRNLRLPMKRGVYPYTGEATPDDQALEILAVGKHQLLLRVYMPQPH